jgi:glycosyltransferase involved in cell wall biosynthesis
VLKNRGCTKVILHIWRPYFARALDLVEYDVGCYHIDDEYSFSDVDLPVADSEVKLISRVDQVFVTTEGLLEKKGKLNPAARLVPNGVDFQAYAMPAAEPLDLQGIPHPRIGYSGVIKWTLDWALLSQLTLHHPDWQFILVGPTQPHPAVIRAVWDLSRRSNVHFLGAKPPDEIRAYPQHFDVCIMPYRLDSHSLKYGYPLKLHEYLATGRPTVGTPLHSLVGVSDVVRLATTHEEWSQALTDCLAPEAMDPRQVEARRTVARQHDWGALVETIAHTLCERLGPHYLAQLRSSPRRPNT